jgi:hypothetical protein
MTGAISGDPLPPSPPAEARTPILSDVTYWLGHLRAVAAKALAKLPRGQRGVWKIALGQGDFSARTLAEATLFEPGPNAFVADPFLFDRENKTFLIYEDYDLSRRKGVISCAQLTETGTEPSVLALQTDYHLSYPFVFEHDGGVFMIPETHQTKRVELWQAEDFPIKWRLVRTVLDGQSVADASLYHAPDGQWWLFANIAAGRVEEHNTRLCLFALDSPQLDGLRPHPLNPVVIDACGGRGAGNVHVDHQGRIIRPGQINRRGPYGYGLTMRQITTLSMTDYAEQEIASVTADDIDGATGVHHLSRLPDGRFAADIKFDWRDQQPSRRTAR